MTCIKVLYYLIIIVSFLQGSTEICSEKEGSSEDQSQTGGINKAIIIPHNQGSNFKIITIQNAFKISCENVTYSD